MQLQDGPAGGRLAAARLADQPERLARRRGRSETPDTACTSATVRRTSPPPRMGKCLTRSRDLEQRPRGPDGVGGDGGRRRSATASRHGTLRCANSIERIVERGDLVGSRSTTPGARPTSVAAERRLGVEAVLPRQRAAGRERAAGRQVDERRRRAGDRASELAAVPASTAGSSRAGRGCRACGARRRCRRPSPTPRPCPAYITRIRSAMPATTPRSWVMRMIAALVSSLIFSSSLEDLGLHGDVEGGGGLVGDDDLGVVGDGHGDHRPLAHAAGELVRVGARPALRRCGMPTRSSSSTARSHACFLETSLMGEHRLGQLPADGVDRVQRRHRVLEDHGDLVARGSTAAAFGGRPTSSSPWNLTEPVIRGGLRQQAHDRHRAHRLPRARLADDAEHLARRQRVARRRARRGRRRRRSGSRRVRSSTSSSSAIRRAPVSAWGRRRRADRHR